MDPQIVLDRLVRLVRLDTTVFEEARDDQAGTVPALVIAAASFFLAGLGGWFWWAVEDFPFKGKAFWQSAILGSVFGIALWIAWIAVAYVVLVNVFRYTGNLERMLRACSYATLPMILMLVMFIPGINLAIGLAALVLMFLLMDIAIQVSIDAQPGHVILATFAGFFVFAIVLSVLIQRDTYLAPGVFLFRLLAAR